MSISRLRWGASLIEFKPTLTTANQVKSVTVNGWDRAKKKAITVKASLDDKELNVNEDLHELLNNVRSARGARGRQAGAFGRGSQKLAHRHSQGPSEGDGEGVRRHCVGLPDLRAGSKGAHRRPGRALLGTYFLTDTTHTLGDSPATSRASNARRESHRSRWRDGSEGRQGRGRSGLSATWTPRCGRVNVDLPVDESARRATGRLSRR